MNSFVVNFKLICITLVEIRAIMISFAWIRLFAFYESLLRQVRAEWELKSNDNLKCNDPIEDNKIEYFFNF